jgi:hypothetical protein
MNPPEQASANFGSTSGSAVTDAPDRKEARRGVRQLMPWGVVLLGVFASWWSTLGASLSDDGHNIALAWRMSLGDAPFVDEMNLRATGSFVAVPFTWLWTQLVGMTGLVLASRLFFVAVAFGTGFLVYRALRTSLPRATAVTATAVPLMALPYHLGQISYNTMPIMGLVLGTAAGFAAICTRDRRWAFGCGAATVTSVISFPTVVIGAAVLLTVVMLLSRQRAVIIAVISGCLVVSLPFALWLLLAVGPSLIADTVRLTLDSQVVAAPMSQRIGNVVAMYTTNLGQWAYWPMWGAALIASLPRLPSRIRAAAVATVPPLAIAPTLFTMLDGSPGMFGRLAGVYATVLCLALIVPVSIWTVQQARRDVGSLMILSLPVAVVQVPLVAAATMSGPHWGVHAIGICSLVMALTAGWQEMLAPAARPVAGTALVAASGLLLTMTPFRDPYPWEATTRITEGAFAGISTEAARAERIADMSAAARRWVAPDEGVLMYGLAGDYLLTRGEPVTNLLWLGAFGGANQATLDYFDRAGRIPDVIFVNRLLIEDHGGYEAVAEEDPLIEFILENYRLVDPEVDAADVFRR